MKIRTHFVGFARITNNKINNNATYNKINKQ